MLVLSRALVGYEIGTIISSLMSVRIRMIMYVWLQHGLSKTDYRYAAVGNVFQNRMLRRSLFKSWARRPKSGQSSTKTPKGVIETS